MSGYRELIPDEKLLEWNRFEKGQETIRLRRKWVHKRSRNKAPLTQILTIYFLRAKFF
jgi:hypothetical protein